jgi:hypothetical protein
MENTYVDYYPENAHTFATQYNVAGEMIEPYYFLPAGAGGNFASLKDVLVYGMFHLGQKVDHQQQILSKESLDMMHNFNRGDESIYALGWANTGHSLVSNGSVSGANSNLTLIPSEGIAIVCLTNMTRYDALADQIADEITDILVPGLEKQITREYFEKRFQTPYEPTPSLLGTWYGQVQSRDSIFPLQFEFRENGDIRISVDGSEAMLENAKYNAFHQLKGTFRSCIKAPGYQGMDTLSIWLNLLHDEGSLYGNIMPMYQSEKGYFAYGMYVGLNKLPDQ